jgi:alpha-galactosidase
MNKTLIKVFLHILLFTPFYSCDRVNNPINHSIGNDYIIFENGSIKLELNDQLMIKVFRKSGDNLYTINRDKKDPFTIVVNGNLINSFSINKSSTEILDIADNIGSGKQLIISGTAKGPSESNIEKKLYLRLYEQFPAIALINVTYKNINSTPGLYIEKEISNLFELDASIINSSHSTHDFWILQGGSYGTRPDWILPVTGDFSYMNYQGQDLETGVCGGGLPVLDVWCKESGFFIGSVSQKPLQISLPAQVDHDGFLNISMEYERDKIKFEEGTYQTIPSVIGVHNGDYYNGLQMYAQVMARNGFEMIKVHPSDPVYNAVWCGWGFGPDFTKKQMYDMIPLLHEFNFKVVTVDMGWFYKNGDYIPRDDTFPAGDEDMRKFVKTFHDEGFQIKIWITTQIAGPQLQKDHPEWLIRNKDGNPIYFDNFKSKVAYLCPALKEVQDYHRELVRKCIGDWDYDGFKVDQQLINSVGDCYAPEHNHHSPSDAFEALPEIYRLMSEETFKLKPKAVFEVCPCGVFPSFYKMPFYNQPVSSDFNTTWQIRHRGKTIKALMGPRAAYYGDHAERHYRKSNFASMLGVGGIPGTMFVGREEDNVEFLRVKYPCYLSPERKPHYKKWFNLYNEYQLSKGDYLNLYDIAYDLPEAHVIKKEDTLYYAFYAAQWDGEIALRGLEDKNYTIIDYVNDIELGKIKGNGKLQVSFEEYLLVKAVPND